MRVDPFKLNAKTRDQCVLYKMLQSHSKRHLSFHTPGHKIGKWDITELSFSDNLSSPKGCIARAEKEIAEILGAARSYITTDGSTSGVLAMLHLCKTLGVERILCLKNSHKSVFNGCALTGLEYETVGVKTRDGIPLPVSVDEIGKKLSGADALLLTSPDYYGNIPDLATISALCKEQGKLFLIDGAHGGHLHFEKTLYAGTYADVWIDGVHKSLPAYTQGAVVSAKTAELGEKLFDSLNVFRTTSPSYPIMASVEYAVRFPRNARLEREVMRLIEKYPDSFYFGGDWTKLCFKVGARAFEVAKAFEKKGIFAEFCDGSVITFYLSPAVKTRNFRFLKSFLERYINDNKKGVRFVPAPDVLKETDGIIAVSDSEKEWIPLSKACGKICALPCGLFPPCTPLLLTGEKIDQEKIRLLTAADNTFGLREGKICVYKKEDTKDE